MRWCLLSIVLLGSWFFAGPAAAEPWLSTRFAQNCAGCHVGGRKNLEPVDRRCTLSCQGCHVNPNGGGLRSQYGKFNEDRWLRTFSVPLLKPQPSTAPVAKQVYGQRPYKGMKFGLKGEILKDGDDDKKKKGAKKKKGPGKIGFPHVEIANVAPPEELYKRDGLEFRKSESRDEFLYQIPQEDPYRQVEQSKTDAGGDVRWQVVRFDLESEVAGESVKAERWNSFLMDVDFAVRHRPLYRNLHLVYEGRMQGNPAENAKYEDMLSQVKMRSLYALVDDLAFNIFVMGGYYKPLFGNYVPDHYALAQEMTTYAMTGQTRNYNVLFNALSFGTAPNVPYLNVHVVQKQVGDPEDKTKGFAANTGMRFVSFGGSVNYSYWRTSDEREGLAPKTTQVEMHSIGGAAKLGRTVAGFDAVSLKRDIDTQDYRQGGVMTLDTYTQFFRENYVTLAYARGNTNVQLLPGDSNEIKLGVRSFLLPGVDLMTVYEIRNETTKDPTTKAEAKASRKGITSQLHLFF